MLIVANRDPNILDANILTTKMAVYFRLGSHRSWTCFVQTLGSLIPGIPSARHFSSDWALETLKTVPSFEPVRVAASLTEADLI